jgi:hypothetical protein
MSQPYPVLARVRSLMRQGHEFTTVARHLGLTWSELADAIHQAFPYFDDKTPVDHFAAAVRAQRRK